MADAAVGFLLQKLSTVLTSYVGLISGAENDLQQLKDDLSFFKSFLRDAAKMPKKLEQMTEIERQIRGVVYDAEDIIDTCLTQANAAASSSSSRNIFRRGAKKVDVSLPLQVRSLREDKVAPIFNKIKLFNDLQIAGGSAAKMEETWSRVRKPQSIRQDNIVGFEDQEAMIVKYLMEQKQELDVISIIGMPGLGKTTLAWKIFQSAKMQFEFPIRIWVNISQLLNRRGVLLNILKEFNIKDTSGRTDHDLDVLVHERLESAGRFLLVMDDVWTVETWNAIKHVLPKTNIVSKVMLTSRNRDVGTHANPQREPHKLRFLTDDESWHLLQLEVYGKINDYPPELKDTGYHTAVQCKGLPLAIVVIGGILLNLRSKTRHTDKIKESWMDVAENVSHFVKNNKDYDISEIVGMSYRRLPNDLKDCFIYLGVFPEDYEIPAWTLMRLWIAEGFIIDNEIQNLEETAEANLNELIDRNLVMVGRINPDDEVKTCRIHDVIRAFCIDKAIEGQNMYQEIRKQRGVFQPSTSGIKNYRRICIHLDVPEFLSEKPKGPHVRSILCFNKLQEDLPEKLTPVIPDGFNLLRVLDSKSIKFMKFPKGVTKLIHLRYITLFDENLDSLPKGISGLWNLQTIVVETNSPSLDIKADIWVMTQLRHLKTKAAIVLAKGDGKGGKNLQTLSRLSPDHCTEDVFKKAPNMKTLGIRGNLNTLYSDGKFLQGLVRLEKLKLVNDKSSLGGSLRSLPKPELFPPFLRRLTISSASLDWKHMSTLAKIDKLRILKLKDKAFKGNLWEAEGSGFPQLHYLLIEDTDLAVWSAPPNYFQCLKSLVLKNCENLVKIPVEVTKKLEILDIDGVGKSAVVSAKEIEAEKKRIQEEQNDDNQWGVQFKLIIGPSC